MSEVEPPVPEELPSAPPPEPAASAAPAADSGDRATAIVAVLLLLSMILFTAIGPRDDKAWKSWVDPLKEFVTGEKAPDKKK